MPKPLWTDEDEAWAGYVRQVVDAAPPASDEQRVGVARLMRSPHEEGRPRRRERPYPDVSDDTAGVRQSASRRGGES